jgi:uncharacterized protein YhaN
MREQLEPLPDTFQKIVRSSEVIYRRVAALEERQRFLEKRLAVLFETIVLLRPELNRKEKEFFKELEDKPSAIAEVKARMEDLHQRVEDILAAGTVGEDDDGAAAARITQAQADTFCQALAEEQEHIRGIVRRVRALKSVVDQLADRQ